MLSSPPDPHLISAREHELLALMSEGLGSNEIAARLGISAKTVSAHKENLKLKLHLPSVRNLVQFALAARDHLNGHENREFAR